MAAEQASTPSVVFRYKENLYISLTTRYSRFIVENLNEYEDGTPVTLFFQCSFETDKEHPAWIDLKTARAETQVQCGCAEFFVLFGPKPPLETRLNVANIMLPRPSAGVSATTTLPMLSYIVKIGHGDCLLGGRIHLWRTWDEHIYKVACDFFDAATTPLLKDFLPLHKVFQELRNTWNILFSVLNQEDCAIPPFDQDLFLHLVRATHNTEAPPTEAPEFMSRALICGREDFTSCSFMRMFHDLVNLIGRFKLVRRLYQAGNFVVVSSHDSLHHKITYRPKSGHVFFFRMTRTKVHETALVIELYRVDEDLKLTASAPVPYVTTKQLEAAGGDPLVAFSHLNSVYADIMKTLTWKDMLCARRVDVQNIEFSQIDDISHVESDGASQIDTNWWESAVMLQ